MINQAREVLLDGLQRGDGETTIAGWSILVHQRVQQHLVLTDEQGCRLVVLLAHLALRSPLDPHRNGTLILYPAVELL
jgi:hypothetical protein